MYLVPGARKELGDITPEDMRIKLPELASLESRGHVTLVHVVHVVAEVVAPEPAAVQEVVVPAPVPEPAPTEVLVNEVPQPKKQKSSPKSSK